mmetsp:Transcript_161589/g.513543  ORF Transcript_161589/g.513543 Transcript_161589/m.513543 type:complete len:85 (+) Transcript_161589:77-331(+)
MKLVIQRVTHASVVADGEMSGKIGPGLMLLLGVEQGNGRRRGQELVRGLRGAVPCGQRGSKPRCHWCLRGLDAGRALQRWTCHR